MKENERTILAIRDILASKGIGLVPVRKTALNGSGVYQIRGIEHIAPYALWTESEVREAFERGELG